MPPSQMPKMWGEQVVARARPKPSFSDVTTRARAIRAARAIQRGYAPSPKPLQSLLTLAGKPGAPRWAKVAFERFTGGAGAAKEV